MYGKPIDSIGFVSQFDPEVAAMMDKEFSRQKDGLELIASENFASPAVRRRVCQCAAPLRRSGQYGCGAGHSEPR